MDYYTNIYLRRLNRYGNSRLERVENQRKENFLNYMNSSNYKVSFTDTYKNEDVVGVLTPYKKDETQTLNILSIWYIIFY